MRYLVLIGILIVCLLVFIFYMQPRCPRCDSKDIGLFRFHNRRVFTCHECGHKDEESKLE